MRYVVFLKAVTLSDQPISPDALVTLIGSLGFPEVETYLASGNVILESPSHAATVKRTLETGLERALGFPVPAFIRTPTELQTIVETLPFPPLRIVRAAAVNVGFLSAPLRPASVAYMKSLNTSLDAFATRDHEFFWLSHTKLSASPFFRLKFETEFGADVTFRPVSVLRRLVDRYGQ